MASGSAHEPLGCAAEGEWAWVQPSFIEALRRMLGRMAYKPGSSFQVREAGDLMLTTVEYDRATGERTPMLYNDERFAARAYLLMQDRGLNLERAVLASFREAVLTEERHEANEWITLDGVGHFDPHAPTDLGLATLTMAAGFEV